MIDDSVHKKLLYTASRRIKQRYFVFSEELFEMTIIPYEGDVRDARDEVYKYDSMCKSVIINYTPKQDWQTSYIECKYIGFRKLVYIRLEDFQKNWKYLRRGISYGIKYNKSFCEEKGINKPEDIVNIEKLVTKNKEPYWDDQVLRFKERNFSDEEKTFRALRRSKMDSASDIYAFSKAENIVHDKTCERVIDIDDKDFDVSSEIPEGYGLCSMCARALLIRKGCYPVTKAIAPCSRFLDGNNVSNAVLKSVIAHGISFVTDTPNELQVKSTEDSWIIKIENGVNVLYHNNYVRVSDVERYITDGYHIQNVSNCSVEDMLKYTSFYSWEKHLKHEKSTAVENELQETIETNLDEMTLIEGITDED